MNLGSLVNLNKSPTAGSFWQNNFSPMNNALKCRVTPQAVAHRISLSNQINSTPIVNNH